MTCSHDMRGVSLSAVSSPSSRFFTGMPIIDLGDNYAVACRALGWDALSTPPGAAGIAWLRGSELVRAAPSDTLDFAIDAAKAVAAESGQSVFIAMAVSIVGDRVLYRTVERADPVPIDKLHAMATDAADEVAAMLKIATLDPGKPGNRATIIRRLADAMIGRAASSEKTATAAAEEILDADWPSLKSAERDKIIRAARDEITKVPIRAVTGINEKISVESKRVMRGSRKAAIQRHDFNIGVSLTQADEAAVEALRETTVSWLTTEYGTRATAFEARAKEIAEAGLQRGLGRDELSKRMFKEFGTKVSGRTESYYRVYAAAVVDRSRSRAELHSYRDASIPTFIASAVLDEATTDFCFAAGTMISTPRGDVLIESICPGDEVVSGSGCIKPVLRVSRRKVSSWVSIMLSSGRPLLVTPEHPILTANGWTKAGDIQRGDCIARKPKMQLQFVGSERSVDEYLRCSQGQVQVESIERIDIGDDNYAYNLEIEEDPTYVAGGVIVHNCRWVDGKSIGVDASIANMERAEKSDMTPEAMKAANPWARLKQVDGQPFWTVGGTKVFETRRSGLGTQARGSYKDQPASKDLEKLRIGAPPYHGHCRTTTIAEL